MGNIYGSLPSSQTMNSQHSEDERQQNQFRQQSMNSTNIDTTNKSNQSIKSNNTEHKPQIEIRQVVATDDEIKQEIHDFIEDLKAQLDQEQKASLLYMKRHNYNDDTLNLFKLMIYDFNLHKTMQYYENDSFCIDYCINKKLRYGCKKQCGLFKHEESPIINLHSTLWTTNSKRQNSEVIIDRFDKKRVLCLYFMYIRLRVPKERKLRD